MNIIQQLQTHGFDFTPVFNSQKLIQYGKRGEGKHGYYKAGYNELGNGKVEKFIYIHDNKSNQKFFFKESSDDFTSEEMAQLKYKDALNEEKWNAENARKHEETRLKALEIYNSGYDLKEPTDYMKKKGWCVTLAGLKTHKDQYTTLMVPLYDVEGVLWSIQYIYFNGDKDYETGCKTKGCFFPLGDFSHPKKIFICEGLATAMSVHAASGTPTVAAMSAGFLDTVAQNLKQKYPNADLVIAADNDSTNEVNAGVNAAISASREVGATYSYPKTIEKMDWNDIHIKHGLEAVKQGLCIEENPFKLDIENGFSLKKTDKTGKISYTPDLVSLLKYFDSKYKFKSLRNTNIIYGWNGTHYQQVSDTEIRGFAMQLIQPITNKNVREEFLDRIYHSNLTREDWFHTSTKGLINLSNGVFDTISGKMMYEHSRDLGFKYCLPYPYIEDAKCPMFDAMLDKVTSGDKARAQLILEYFGYALSGDSCLADKVLVMTGEGSNGKSRFVNVMRKLMGHSSISLMSRDFDKDSKLLRLDNALLGVIEEMPSFVSKEFWEQIKGLSSGNSITADVKFKDAREFENRCKFVFTCNKLPHGTDPSHGFHRRLLIVPFEHTFSRDDEDFVADIDKKIIESELSGVFNRVYKAYLPVRARGYTFTSSESVNAKLEEYKLDSDSVARWCVEVEFRIDPSSLVKIAGKDVYNHYLQWCKEQNINPVNGIEFWRRMNSRFKKLEALRCRVERNKERFTGYSGIKFESQTPNF